MLTKIRSEFYAVAQLVEGLRCKPEGRRFDCRWGDGD